MIVWISRTLALAIHDRQLACGQQFGTILQIGLHYNRLLLTNALHQQLQLRQTGLWQRHFHTDRI